MSNYNSLKTTIDANIKQNGNQEITGQILNSVLNAMVNTLGAGYQFAGVATTATNPGSPDAKVFYIANGKGTYTNFGGVEVTEDDVVVLYWEASWHKVSTGIASQEKLTELKEKVDALALGAFYGYFPDSASLPTDVTIPGYSYVGLDNPYKIWNFNGESWSDSGTSIDMNDADEEDLTRNTDGKLQFKNRAYGDGMGYVILRKDKTFAEQVTKENTIYEIRYDFEIGGTSSSPFEMPINSVLRFIGGKLTGGFLKGVDTCIHASVDQIFDNVSLLGSWNVDECYPEWFGAKGDGNTDDASAWQVTMDCPIANVCAVNKYMVASEIEFSVSKNLYGGGEIYAQSVTTGKIGLFRALNCDYFKVRDIKFTSVRDSTQIYPPAGHTRPTGSKSSNRSFLIGRNVVSFEIRDVSFSNSEFDFVAYDCTLLYVANAISKNASMHTYFVNCEKAVFENGKVELYDILGNGDHPFYIGHGNGNVDIHDYYIDSSTIPYAIHSYASEAQHGEYGRTKKVVVSNCEIISTAICACCVDDVMSFNNCRIRQTGSRTDVFYAESGKIVFNSCLLELNNVLGINSSLLSDFDFNDCVISHRLDFGGFTKQVNINNCLIKDITTTQETTGVINVRDTYFEPEINRFCVSNFASGEKVFLYGCVFKANSDGILNCRGLRDVGSEIITNFYNCTGTNVKSYFSYLAGNSNAIVNLHNCDFSKIRIRRNDSDVIFRIYNTKLLDYDNGGSNNRPQTPFVGQLYFDTTLNKPIYWTGSKWVDATGADV